MHDQAEDTKKAITRRKYALSIMKPLYSALCLAPIKSESNLLYTEAVQMIKTILNINGGTFVNDMAKTEQAFVKNVGEIVEEITASVVSDILFSFFCLWFCSSPPPPPPAAAQEPRSWRGQ